MTPAEALTAALGGRWHGGYGMARCPAHDDRTPSLSLRDGERQVLFFCFAGCRSNDIVEELRRRGLFSGRAPMHSQLAATSATQPPDTRAAALRMWLAAQSIAGTFGERYLRRRGIEIALPPTLRFHGGLRHAPTGRLMPAMVAGVQSADGRVIAVHRTWLAADGQGKVDVEPNKMALGQLGAGAVRLAPACGHFVGICEGIETGLSATQLFQNFPVWCSLGTERLSRLWLPPEIHLVVIFADRDEAGARAAEKAAAFYATTGRLVQIQFPDVGSDFNEMLRVKTAAA